MFWQREWLNYLVVPPPEWQKRHIQGPTLERQQQWWNFPPFPRRVADSKSKELWPLLWPQDSHWSVKGLVSRYAHLWARRHFVEALPLKEIGFLPRWYSDMAASNLQTVINLSGSGTWPRTFRHATFLADVSWSWKQVQSSSFLQTAVANVHITTGTSVPSSVCRPHQNAKQRSGNALVIDVISPQPDLNCNSSFFFMTFQSVQNPAI